MCKKHEKFSQIILLCGLKKTSECIFQVWNGRIKGNNYPEVHCLYGKQYVEIREQNCISKM